MSTTGSIGYIDQNGNYRGTVVGADAYPEDVMAVIPSMLARMSSESFINWVENGIAGGGYDGLYNDETLDERGEADGPRLIDADNYDSWLDYAYVVTDGKVELFDPKNVMGYDADDDEHDADLES